MGIQHSSGPAVASLLLMPGGERLVCAFEELTGLNEDWMLVSVLLPWKNSFHVPGPRENMDKCFLAHPVGG